MPFLSQSSQATNRAIQWFGEPMGLKLMQQFQRQAIPEITRVFGHSGLYLSPHSSYAAELSGNMLAQVLSLHRDTKGLAGAFRCEDEHLPITSESLSLTYSLCVLETSPNPEALFDEMVRCLKPEGVMVLLGLNAISPARLRWQAKGINTVGTATLRHWCAKQGLEISKLSQIGPVWLSPNKIPQRYKEKPGFLNFFYAGHLLVAKRRVAGLTPLRKTGQTYHLNPGVSPG